MTTTTTEKESFYLLPMANLWVYGYVMVGGLILEMLLNI